MSDIFHNYMSKRLEEINFDNLKTNSGPVITISRVAGCSALSIAKKLEAKLNQINTVQNWTYISKDVLRESAQEMKLKPKKIKAIFKVKDRTVLEEIMQAFLSKDYQLENKMRKTVIKVIHNFAVEGHKIIIGRAAHVICKDIQNALHVRINAPLKWRIDKVIQTKNYSKEKAVECIAETEKDRLKFRKKIKGKPDDDFIFDITINQSSYSIDEIAELIINAYHLKLKSN